MSACSTTTHERVSPGSDGRDLRGNPRSANATGAPDLPPIPLRGGDGGGEAATLSSTRLRFWLSVMDVLARVGLFGSPLFQWAVRRASDAIDWRAQ